MSQSHPNICFPMKLKCFVDSKKFSSPMNSTKKCLKLESYLKWFSVKVNLTKQQQMNELSTKLVVFLFMIVCQFIVEFKLSFSQLLNSLKPYKFTPKQKLFLDQNRTMFNKMRKMGSLITDPLNQFKAEIKQGIKSGINALQRQDITVIQIVSHKLFHIDYPNKKNIRSLITKLQEAKEYQIWNISEYPYSEQILSAILREGGRNSDGKQRVFNLTYEYFSHIPFCEMFKAIESIEAFLAMHQNNQVFIHCQNNRRRSSIFLSSYLFLTGIQSDMVQAIISVNKSLEVSTQDKKIKNLRSSTYKSQHLALKNLINYISDSSFINKNTWLLKKILISNAPSVKSLISPKKENEYPSMGDDQNDQEGQEKVVLEFKVLLEIRSQHGTIFRNIFDEDFVEGQSLCLRLKDPILLKDDFLIIVKYVYEKKGFSVLRTQLNTNFMYENFYRVNRQQMDLSTKNTKTNNENIFMDLELIKNEKEKSDLSKLSFLKDQHNYSVNENKQNDGEFKKEYSQPRKISQEDEDFKIIDEEELAAQNEKINQQVEEEFEKELRSLRERQKSSNSSEEQKQNAEQIDEKNIENERVGKDKQASDKEKEEQGQEIIDAAESLKQDIPQTKKGEKQNEIQGEESQKSESRKSSSSKQSSSESSGDSQNQDEQEDLDSYLQKLQKGAQ